jgi:hypothetical protein
MSRLTTAMVDSFVWKHNQWKSFKVAANNMTLPAVSIPTLVKKIGRILVMQFENYFHVNRVHLVYL